MPMHTSRRFFNEKLPTRTESLFKILFTVMFFFLVAATAPYLKPRRYSGSGINWLLASALSVMFVLRSFFEKIFVSIHFDYESKVVNITSRTILDSDKIHEIPFTELEYQERKEGSMRVKPTKLLAFFRGNHQLIKFKATDIGEYTFDEICKEITALKSTAQN